MQVPRPHVFKKFLICRLLVGLDQRITFEEAHMLSREKFTAAQQQAKEYLARAGIVITPEEAANIEVADFGLNELDSTGLELVVYVNTDRVCAKELVLF